MATAVVKVELNDGSVSHKPHEIPVVIVHPSANGLTLSQAKYNKQGDGYQLEVLDDKLCVLILPAVFSYLKKTYELPDPVRIFRPNEPVTASYKRQVGIDLGEITNQLAQLKKDVAEQLAQLKKDVAGVEQSAKTASDAILRIQDPRSGILAVAEQSATQKDGELNLALQQRIRVVQDNVFVVARAVGDRKPVPDGDLA